MREGKAAEEHPPGQVPVILIVEDHAANLGMVRRMLSRAFPSTAIAGVRTAEKALAECARHTPRVVVMDLFLPGMSGLDATRRIKAQWPAVRVVVHSSQEEAVYREGAMRAGADAFIGKSRTSRDLVPAIGLQLDACARTG